jgi:hypothetical protein
MQREMALLATWDFGFLETHLQLRLPAGALVSAGFNVFKDGRPSYFTLGPRAPGSESFAAAMAAVKPR